MINGSDMSQGRGAVCGSLGSTGGSASSSSSGDNMALKEVYSRFGAAALVNTTVLGTASLISALLLFRRKGLRVFSFGLGVGAPLGWCLRDADLYLKDPQTYGHLLPASCDPLMLAQQQQQRLRQQLKTGFNLPSLSELKNKFFP